MAKERGRNKGSGSSVNGDETRLAMLERRLSAAERTLELVRASRLGGELRALEFAARQREIDTHDDRASAERRAAAADARARVFGTFAAERIVLHPDLATTHRALTKAYQEWCRENDVPRLHRCESQDELLHAVATVLPEAEAADVRPEAYLGRPGYTEPGYTNVGFAAVGDDPIEAAKTLTAEADHAERERRARREDHALAARVEDDIVQRRRTRDAAARLAAEAAT